MLPGIPSPGIIRITREGDLVVEGPIPTGDDAVARAALLLTNLLPGFDALPEYRASGPLRLVIARALGSIDLPPYPSLYEFRAALTRFATEDVRDVAQALFSSWERARVTGAFNAAPRASLTISDVRRARRATGMSLGYLSTVAEVPSRRLRDLEWGYMRDWPATAEARAQVIRYARAAGLDEGIVLSVAWPMIVENASSPAGPVTTTTALVKVGPRALAVIPAPLAPSHHSLRAALVAAAATVALLAAFAFGWRSSSASPVPPARDTVQVGLSGHDSPPVVPTPPSVAGGSQAREDAAAPAPAGVRAVATGGESEPPRVVPAVAGGPRAAPPRDPAPAKAKRRRPAATRHEPREEPRKPVLERELFRIVIR
ncbi:MAG TPA: hypothetical protein VFK57_15950 [Vicinamibacterales bacterium]|nr:hypothetical protein [Vicinamibacterales bacterium]